MKIDQKARSILKSFPRDVQNYFHEIEEKCNQHGVVFRVSGGKKVYSGSGGCGGFFSDDPAELAVAIDKPLKWVIATLVHEDSHFDQWLDKNSIWHDKSIAKKINNFFYWLMKLKNIENPTETAKNVIALEADCERRSLKKVKERWSHIISPEDYAQSANAYMFSYLYMAKSGKWISDKVKLRNKCFFRNFPAKILRQFNNLSDQHLALFYKYDKKCKSGSE